MRFQCSKYDDALAYQSRLQRPEVRNQYAACEWAVKFYNFGNLHVLTNKPQ